MGKTTLERAIGLCVLNVSPQPFLTSPALGAKEIGKAITILWTTAQNAETSIQENPYLTGLITCLRQQTINGRMRFSALNRQR